MNIIQKKEWLIARREKLQDYDDYKFVFESANKSIYIITKNLESPEKVSSSPRSGVMRGARRRAEASLEEVIYGYSAGHSVLELSLFFRQVVTHWNDSTKHHLSFEVSNENDGHKIPHLDLYDTDYWIALQLICFAILLNHSAELHNIMDLLVHENDDQDALLEALVAPYLPGRPGSTIYTRQLPYRKTRHIFQAEPDQRPALMARYLKEWYLASRREPYHNRHKSALFPGYWSLEAGAITFILGIDDSTYRDMPFYPKDLVDYARSVSSPPGQSKPVNPHPPRKAAGEICPKTGWWFTMAKANSPRYFQQGVKFPNIEGSDYGLTFWQWSQDQLPPPLI